MTALLNGYFLLNKPKDISSFWAISRARNSLSKNTNIPFKQIKVGHAGTLDPLAEGLLLCAVGKSTKMLSHLLLTDKKYKAELFLGQCSTTDDEEGEKFSPDYKQENTTPTRKEIETVIQKFIGKIEQTPPCFSALKINGKRACDRVRNTQQENTKTSANTELTRDEISEIMQKKTRSIEIFDIKILQYEYPLLTIEAHCGTGTYIRSLARDIGKALHQGAYLSFLKRTHVGNFSLNNAVHHNEIQPSDIKQFTRCAFTESIPSLNIQNEKICERLYHGQKISFNDIDFTEERNIKTREIYKKNTNHIPKILLWNNNRLLGIGEMKHNILLPRKIV